MGSTFFGPIQEIFVCANVIKMFYVFWGLFVCFSFSTGSQLKLLLCIWYKVRAKIFFSYKYTTDLLPLWEEHYCLFNGITFALIRWPFISNCVSVICLLLHLSVWLNLQQYHILLINIVWWQILISDSPASIHLHNCSDHS